MKFMIEYGFEPRDWCIYLLTYYIMHNIIIFITENLYVLLHT